MTSISTRSASPGRTGFDQISSPPVPRMPPAGRKSLVRHAHAPGGQRNVSAMIAAIKPNVPNQLAISINSSVMRQASPCCSAIAPDTGQGTESTSVKKESCPLLSGRRKCEGAPGSLATLASDRGPSHPRSTTHGSRLPAISRRGAASRLDDKLSTPKRAPQVTHRGTRVGVSRNERTHRPGGTAPRCAGLLAVLAPCGCCGREGAEA